MRRRILLLALVLAAAPGAAQQQITKHSIDNGGGASSSARYRITGTVGQHDAVPVLEGGRYRLGGGFWTAPPGIFRDGFED